jgi:predicted  nucleic acid-binding Zn-ribbon protein
MPHQCVRCSRIIPVGSKEILAGCQDCGSHFFFYIKEEQLENLKKNPIVLHEKDKDKIEKDVREMVGIEEETTPVILDVESVRILGPGKFEIDIVHLFNEKRPIIYKLEEGKYIIDIARTLGKYKREGEINGKNNSKKI